jgi:lipopolysaccharide transport system permease protein
VVVREHRPRMLETMREVWRHRSLIPRIGVRVVVKGYSGAKLGRAWLVIRPCMSIFAMALLFGAVLGAPSEGVPYILFLLVGMMAWLTFERSLFWATRSFDVYRRLANHLAFPLVLIPTASAIPAAIELAVLSGLTACTLLYFGIVDGTLYVQASAELALAVAGLGLAYAFAWGLGLWLAPLNAKARDVRITLRYVFLVWMYVTPVIYPVTALPDGWRFLATINPVAAPVELVKRGLLGIGTVQAGSLLVSIATTVLVCISGLWFFTRVAPTLLRRDAGLTDDEEDLV